MTRRASGSFDITLTPEGPSDSADGATLGGMSIDKQYTGDLVGTGIGRMLSAVTEVKGSAGYVALERVSGTLHRLTGTFILQHSGIMSGDERSLVITVVPDSGTGDLVGLSGTKVITIEDGKHFYELEYDLPESSSSSDPTT